MAAAYNVPADFVTNPARTIISHPDPAQFARDIAPRYFSNGIRQGNNSLHILFNIVKYCDSNQENTVNLNNLKIFIQGWEEERNYTNVTFRKDIAGENEYYISYLNALPMHSYFEKLLPIHLNISNTIVMHIIDYKMNPSSNFDKSLIIDSFTGFTYPDGTPVLSTNNSNALERLRGYIPSLPKSYNKPPMRKTKCQFGKKCRFATRIGTSNEKLGNMNHMRKYTHGGTRRARRTRKTRKTRKYSKK